MKYMENESVADAKQLLGNKEKIPFTFDKIARRYDLATRLSQGYSKDLERSVSLMNLEGHEEVLDLCCGTGKSTKYCLQAVPNGKIIAVDNSSGMIGVAMENFAEEIAKRNCHFVVQDVMQLELPENSMDAIFMAYGIRNMPDYEKCLNNLFRILKPGGTLAIHEFSLKNGRFSRFYWKILGYSIIIPFSTLITGQFTIFKYLINSVLEFPSPSLFKKMLLKSGFTNADYYPQPSWRKFILHTFIAIKPF